MNDDRYGVKPTGFVRKPLPLILRQIENKRITEFGADVIQTAQSPMGQVNGIEADVIAEQWELCEHVYQSLDPNQAEGQRLDQIGEIRLLKRGSDNDENYRLAITNEGRADFRLADLERALKGVDGVTYCNIFVGSHDKKTEYILAGKRIAVVVIGGDDTLVAQSVNKYILNGVPTYGNTQVYSKDADGFCRTDYIVRPLDVPCKLKIEVKAQPSECPPPSLVDVEAAIFDTWRIDQQNGVDIDQYSIRGIIETRFPNIRLMSCQSERDGLGYQPTTRIEFIEIASFKDTADIDVKWVVS